MTDSRFTHCAMAVLMACALSAFTFPGSARAGGKKVFFAGLNGYQEVPSLSSSGKGSFLATLNDGELRFVLSYSGLAGTAVQAHIHLGQRATTGGVVAFLCGGPVEACPPDGGTVSGTITAAEVIGGAAGQGLDAGEFDELVRAMAAGATYINVHTDLYPSGEIRGQVH